MRLNVLKQRMYPVSGHDAYRLDTVIAHNGELEIEYSRYYIDTDGLTYCHLVPVEPDEVIAGVREYWTVIRRYPRVTKTAQVNGVQINITRVLFARRLPGAKRGRPRKRLPDIL